MSGKIMGKVWDLDLPHNQLLVLLAMADHADHEGNNVFPSLGLVAWKTGYSEQQVRRVLRQLEKSKILVAVERASGKRTIYQINIAAGKQKEPRVITPSKMSGVSKSKGLHFDGATPDIPREEVKGINRHLEPSIKNTPKSLVLDMPTDVNKWSELNLNTYYGQHRADLKVMAVALAINIDTVPWENWTLSERRNVIKRHRFILRDGLDVSAYTHYLMNEFHWRQPCRLNLSDYDNNVSKYKTALIKSTARPRVPIPLHDEPIQPVENITPEERQRMADETRAAFLTPRQAVVNE